MKSMLTLVLSASAALAQTGHWTGTIQIPEHELGISVDLAKNPKGVWTGSMSVLTATAVEVPLTSVAVDGSAVKFDASLPTAASFSGQISADGSGLTGTASSKDGDAPFKLTKAGEAHVFVPPASSKLPEELAGNWEGSVESSGTVRRIGLKLSAAADGIANATIIAIDRGGLEIPVTTVTIKGKELVLEARSVSGSYRGALIGGEITGEWLEGSNHQPLTFKRAAKE